ncbi:unnamed protein product [Heterosigma akashiwo]|mmetsp:Transcript_29041/g.45788  ORF Transcript_29041/g.45788 Transcript_29041/m.45788 type:complete len:216 (-) Transcript_29041:329-976(-)
MASVFGWLATVMPILLLLVLFFSPTYSHYEESKDVVSLTSKNFASQTASRKWFLKFYAPWCGHCQQLVPVWEELASELQGEVSVGAIDCDKEKAVCSQFNVRGYPSLLFLTEKKDVYTYEGDRMMESMADFARGAYQYQAPLGWKESPFGPAGWLKRVLMLIILEAISLHSRLTGWGMPNIAAIITMFFFGMMLCLAWMIALENTFKLIFKSKRD